MDKPVKLPTGARHGTSVAYNKHKCRCPKCRRFNREYNAAYRANNPEAFRRQKRNVLAHRRAMTRLRERMPDLYTEFYEEELQRQ